MFITNYRRSKAFRLTAFLILLDFLSFQNLYGQEYAIQEGTHLYTPVRDKGLLKVFVASALHPVAPTPQNRIFPEIHLEIEIEKPYFGAKTKR